MTTLSNANYHVYNAQGPKQVAYSKIVIHEEPYTPNAKFEIKHSGSVRGVVYESMSSTLDSSLTAVDNPIIKAKREVITDPKSGEKIIKLTFASKAGVDLSNLTINGNKIDLNKVENQIPNTKPNEDKTKKKDEFTNARSGVIITDPKPEEKRLYSKIITINTGEKPNANFEINSSFEQGGSRFNSWNTNLASNVFSSDNSAMKIKRETYIDAETNQELTRLVIAVKNGVDLSNLKVNNKNIDLGASKESKGYSPVVLTEDEKKYYSKKFVIPLPINGSDKFAITKKESLINGASSTTTHQYVSDTESSIGWGDSVTISTKAKVNRVTLKKDKQLILGIKKGKEPSALIVNGVAIDLNAEPTQGLATKDDYSHQTQIKNDGSEISKNGLELENSGSIQYPANHSVFTVTSQNHETSTYAVTTEQYNQAIENKKDGYKHLYNGSPYLATLADNMVRAGENDTLSSVLKKTSLNTEIMSSIPFHRISPESRAESQQNKDFEILFITGRGYQTTHAGKFFTREDDERRFLFDSKMLKHAINNSKFKDECKEFQHLPNPSLSQLDAAIQQRAESAKANNRRLLIVYSGHGNVTEMNSSQYGINTQDFYKEGSKRFKFGTDNSFTEDDYKKILNKYLGEVQTIHVINACHSGAALTMKASETSYDLLYA